MLYGMTYLHMRGENFSAKVGVCDGTTHLQECGESTYSLWLPC